MRGPRRRRQGDDGAAAVEMALMVPLLMLLVFAIIQFGIALSQKLALSNGARQGARYGAVPNPNPTTGATTTTCQAILTEVQQAASTALGMSGNAVGVTISAPAGSTQPCTSTGPATTSTDFGATALNDPCIGKTSGEDLKVIANYTGSLNIPFGPNVSLPMQSQGVYECEFSS